MLTNHEVISMYCIVLMWWDDIDGLLTQKKITVLLFSRVCNTMFTPKQTEHWLGNNFTLNVSNLCQESDNGKRMYDKHTTCHFYKLQ